MTTRNLQDLPVKGLNVLLRVDFNTPLDETGEVADDTRIRSSLATIEYLLDQGAAVILMSHLGRPKGARSAHLSLAPVARRLAEILGRPVEMAPDCVGDQVEERAKALKPGDLLMLENLRFHIGEEAPEEDPSFGEKLARLGDAYVNDAFGTAHRNHTSTVVLPKLFPEKAAAGFLLQKELKFLDKALQDPQKPFYAIIGGAKVSSKLGVLKALADKVDAIFIGGGMAFTFLKAQGVSIGLSLCEDELLETTREIIEHCRARGTALHLPIDIRIAKEFANDTTTWLVDTNAGIPNQCRGMDIGPKTVEAWNQLIVRAATILWNGPLGVFEFPKFAQGTTEIATTVAHSPALSIVGGGDSIAAIQAAGVSQQISHISTGGGATLEFIEHGHLPGIDLLKRPCYITQVPEIQEDTSS